MKSWVTFQKMFRSKTQPKSGKSDQHNTFCEEEGKLSCQTSSEMEMGTYYTRENLFNLSVIWKYITVKGHKTKMHDDTGADSTMISSFIWRELGKPQLNGKAFVKSDKKIGLLGRDKLPQEGIKAVSDE